MKAFSKAAHTDTRKAAYQLAELYESLGRTPDSERLRLIAEGN